MDAKTLEDKIAQLPPTEKKKAEEFVDGLLADLKKSIAEKKPQPVFGSGKGLITYMADDFDAPLEDFKEYM
jgi:hypothetical protein